MSDMSHQDGPSKAEREFFGGSWFNPPSVNAITDLEQRVKRWRWIASAAIAIALLVVGAETLVTSEVLKNMEREVATAWMEMDSQQATHEPDGFVYFSVSFDSPSPEQVNYYVTVNFEPAEEPDSTLAASEDPEDDEADVSCSPALYEVASEISL